MRQIVIPAIVAIVVAVAALALAPRFLPGAAQNAPAAKETTYERVLRTGTVRCGYTVWNPLFIVDTVNGGKKGIFHDVMEEVGKRLDLKIVWQEELGWGTVVEGVRNGRVDMACAGYWLNYARIKNVLSSIPQLYSPLYVWMRQNDTRSFADPEELNSPQYTAGSIDGSADSQIVARRFPKAKLVSLPETGTNSDMIENLVAGKVDFIIVDASTLAAYIANNPGKVKNAFPGRPMNVFPNVMLLPPDDLRFKDVIDNALRSIEYDGTLDAILKTYRMENLFMRNPKPVAASP